MKKHTETWTAMIKRR